MASPTTAGLPCARRRGRWPPNLTDDPEVRYTEAGIARAVFRLAVSSRREQEPSLFTVIVWRDQAEHAAQVSLRRCSSSGVTTASCQRSPANARIDSTSSQAVRRGTQSSRRGSSSMPAFRSVVSVLLRVLGDFSLHPQGHTTRTGAAGPTLGRVGPIGHRVESRRAALPPQSSAAACPGSASGGYYPDSRQRPSGRGPLPPRAHHDDRPPAPRSAGSAGSGLVHSGFRLARML
jgi:hypothetical protein